MTSGVQSGWEATGRLQGLAGTRTLQGQGNTEKEMCRNVVADGERARAKRQGERMILGICILGTSDPQAPSVLPAALLLLFGTSFWAWMCTALCVRVWTCLVPPFSKTATRTSSSGESVRSRSHVRPTESKIQM